MDLGMAEARLDQRRYLDSSDKNVPVSSSESVLLKIITSTNDVEFNDITIDDFGVRFQFFFISKLSNRTTLIWNHPGFYG